MSNEFYEEACDKCFEEIKVSRAEVDHYKSEAARIAAKYNDLAGKYNALLRELDQAKLAVEVTNANWRSIANDL